MLKLASLLVVLVLVDLGWSRTVNVHRGDLAASPVTAECVQKALDGDCDFYQCFEQRHPCHWNNFAIRHGWTFCRRLDSEFVNLTPEGQQWLTNTRQCAMGTMLAYYRSDRRQCQNFERHMVGVHSSCSVQMGICNADLLLANRAVLLRVYTLSPEVVDKFLTTLEHCSEESIQPIVDWLKSTYATAVDHASALLDELPSVSDVRRKLPTKQEILDQLPSAAEIRALLPSNEEIVRMLPSREDLSRLGDEISSALPSSEEIRRAVPSREEIMSGLRSGQRAISNKLPSEQEMKRGISKVGRWFNAMLDKLDA